MSGRLLLGLVCLLCKPPPSPPFFSHLSGFCVDANAVGVGSLIDEALKYFERRLYDQRVEQPSSSSSSAEKKQNGKIKAA